MKILIAYATRFGTTEKCALILAEILRKKNYEVELADLKKNKKVRPEDYDLAVIGGSFLMARMNKYVKGFVKRNFKVLLSMKTAIFMCGADENWEDEIKKGFPADLLDRAAVRGYFGYELNWERMNPMMRNMMKKASEDTEAEPAIKTENISKFAEEVAQALS